MLPSSFSLRGFLMACLACAALPALAIGIDQGAVDLPSSVTPEGVGVVGFLYAFHKYHMRQARQLDAAIKALAARVAPEEEE